MRWIHDLRHPFRWLTRSARTATVVLALALAASACPRDSVPDPIATPPPPAPAPAAPRSVTPGYVAPTLPEYLTDSAILALAMIQPSAADLMPSAAVQSFERTAGTIQVFFVRPATPSQGPAVTDELPSLCALMRRPVSVCIQDVCQDVPTADSPAILCNIDALEEIEALVRLAHDQPVLDTFFATDVAFMGQLRKLRDPAERRKITEETREALSYDHMVQHWFLPLTFLLAHEIHHLRDEEMPAPATPGDPPQATGEKADLSAMLHCINAEHFDRAEVAESRMDVRPQLEAARRRLAGDGAARQTIDAVDRVWRDEFAADRFATEVVVAAMERIRDKLDVYADNTAENLAEALSYIAARSWYTRLSQILVFPCGAAAKSDFILTRCLCASPDAYLSIGPFFEATHPPMYLRINQVFNVLLETTLVDHVTERSRNMIAWVRTMGQTASTMAHVACFASDKTHGLRADKTHLFVVYPAIDGFHGQPQRMVGGPSRETVLEIVEQCGKNAVNFLAFDL